jgi:hypothetical protein
MFDLRVFLGMLLALAGVLPALLGLGTFSAQAQQNYSTTSSIHPLVPAFFDCSKIREMGIDKQQNLRAGAIMIFCGEAKGGEPDEASLSNAFSKLVQRAMAPLTYGTTDVDLNTGTETFPHITQSETFTTANPDDPTQIVVAYNDSRGFDANPMTGAGASVSTDGGNTFTRLTKANGKARSTIAVAPLFCITSRLRPGLQCGSTVAAAVLAGTDPLLPGIRIAGPISASTAA